MIIIFTTLVLISCVQAKNSLMQRKSLFLGKKNKKNRPGGGANGRRPQAGEKKHKKPNTLHRQIFGISPGEKDRYTGYQKRIDTRGTLS